MGRFINADAYASTGQGILGNNMFAYCRNSPISKVDHCGTTDAAVLEWWIGTMWWLPAVDTILIIGDIIYYGGIAILSIASIYALFQVAESVSTESKTEADPEPPDVTYPGDDPGKAPEGSSWKGKGEQGSKQGNYYDPDTGRSWHPDLDHDPPIGPHWDLKDDGTWWRVFPDGSITLK